MSFIRLNTTDNTVSEITEKRYTELYPGGLLNNGVIELEVIHTPAPPFNHLTHRLINDNYKRVEDNWVRQWRVEPLSDYEIALRDWKHLDYQFRLRVPRHLGEEYPGLYAHFKLFNLPIEDYTAQIVDVYINTILQHHSNLLQSLQNVVEVHSRPEILTPDETPLG